MPLETRAGTAMLALVLLSCQARPGQPSLPFKAVMQPLAHNCVSDPAMHPQEKPVTLGPWHPSTHMLMCLPDAVLFLLPRGREPKEQRWEIPSPQVKELAKSEPAVCSWGF